MVEKTAMPEELITLMQEFVHKSEQNQSYLRELRENDREDRREIKTTLKENRDCVSKINATLSKIIEHANGQARLCKTRGKACEHKHAQYDRAIEAYPSPKEVDDRYIKIQKFEEGVADHLNGVDKAVNTKMDTVQKEVNAKMDSILSAVQVKIDAVLPSVYKRNAIVTVAASVFGVVSGWGFTIAFKQFFK